MIYQLSGSTPVQPPADDASTNKTQTLTLTSFTSVSLSDTERNPGNPGNPVKQK